MKGEPVSALFQPGLLKNPFTPPRKGYDDGHPAIDLSYWSGPDGKSMLGLPILSTLDGKVAAVLPNRSPYGNAVIIETPLERFPAEWRSKLSLPLPERDLQSSYSLSCPDYRDFTFQVSPLSVFVLYAHMDQPSPLQTGETVACGQTIGAVGTTGNSVNPHLHLEMRTGPAGGINFASMAHYDARATAEERKAYCVWRISGAFPPFDPLSLFRLTLQDR